MWKREQDDGPQASPLDALAIGRGEVHSRRVHAWQLPLVGRVVHQFGTHPMLACGIHDEHKRGGFATCHLDLAHRCSRSVTVAC